MNEDAFPGRRVGTQFRDRVRAARGLTFLELSSRLAEGALERPVFLLLGEASDTRTTAILEQIERRGETRAIVRDSFHFVAADRRVEPAAWEWMAPKVEALTGRFGVPWLGFLTPTGETFFGAVSVTPEAQQDLPGLEQILTFARNLHEADPEKTRSSGIPFDEHPGPEEEPLPAEDGPAPGTLFPRVARWLRRRQDLHSLAFPGRAHPGLPTMLYWIRHWERFRDRGLDVRLQRLLDGFGRLLNDEPRNPWSALWTLFMAGRVVHAATTATGLETSRAREDVGRRLASWAPDGDALDEELRAAAATFLGSGNGEARRNFLAAWSADVSSGGPEPWIDWDHPSHGALRLEEAFEAGDDSAARELGEAWELRVAELGLAGISLAAALLHPRAPSPEQP